MARRTLLPAPRPELVSLLQDLNLQNNAISDTGATALLESPNFPQLKRVKLDGNSTISGLVLKALEKWFPES